MDGTTKESPRVKNNRFLANVNSEDSIHKSANLLEEILGKKLDKLKMQTTLRESAQKSSNTNTKVQESKAEEPVKDKLEMVDRIEEKLVECLSVQVKPKYSPRQSEPSQSQVESLLSGSLQKRKSAEKDQYNITTQDGFKSEKNSEMFDLRIHKVPAGVLAPLDSVSQGSGEHDMSNGDKINQLEQHTPFDQVMESEKKPHVEKELEYRRSLTEKQINMQRNGQLESNGQGSKEKTGLSRFHEYNSRARRTPTDTFIADSSPSRPNHSEKTVLLKGKTLQQKQKDHSSINGLRPGISLRRPFNGVGGSTSTHRGMLEYSDNNINPKSTDNFAINENSSVISPRPDNIPTNRERSSPISQPHGPKSCLKQPAIKNSPEKSELSSPMRSVSPAGSKRGILTNRDRVFHSDNLSVYEMAGMPARRSNTIMSRKPPGRVRFKDLPEIHHVVSYKRYYKENYSDVTFCSRCSLI